MTQSIVDPEALTGPIRIGGDETSCEAELTDGVGSCELRFLSMGEKSVRASSMGVNEGKPNMHMPLEVTVEQAHSNIVDIDYDTNVHNYRAGRSYELRAQVAAANDSILRPTGIVNFGVCQGTVDPDDEDWARCEFTPETVGPLTITPVYSGDENFLEAAHPPIHVTIRPGDLRTLEILGGGTQTTTVATEFQEALTVQSQDAYGHPILGVTVAFGTSTHAASATFDASTVVTDGDGRAFVRATANDVAGTYTVEARSGLTFAPFQLENTAGPVHRADLIKGDSQSAVVHTVFDDKLELQVFDVYGNKVRKAMVLFSNPESGASAVLEASSLESNAQGQVFNRATANTVAGSYSVEAHVAGINEPVLFHLENLHDVPAQLTRSSASSPQSARITEPFQEALTVVLTDDYGNPVPETLVSFSAPDTGASASLSATEAKTNPDGQASVTAIANTLPASFEVLASAFGLEARFQLTNLVGVPASVLAMSASSDQHAEVETDFVEPLIVTVIDAHQNPVEGVQIRFEAPNAGASALLSADTATTDAHGNAQISASANAFHGSYEVRAILDEGASPALFALSNDARPTRTTLQVAQTMQGVGEAIAVEVSVEAAKGTPTGELVIRSGDITVGTLTLHAILPVALVQTGDDALTSTALGDLRLGARVRLFGGLEGAAPSRFGLGIEGQVILPTGNDRAYASDDKARGRILLLAEGLPANFLYIGANVGVMLRSEVDQAANLGHALLVSGSIGYRSFQDKFRLGLEANSDISLVKNEPSVPTNAVEAYAVGSVRFLNGLHATVGVGPGFTDTSGTPSVRAVARIGWAPNVKRQERPATLQEDDETSAVSAPEPVEEEEPAPTPEPIEELPPVEEPQPADEPTPEPIEEPEIVEEEEPAPSLTDIPTTIRFEYDGAQLAPGSDAALRSVAQQLKEHSETRISIEGHCDSRGTDAFNDALSVRRAEVVQRALVRHGVPKANLQVVGHGKRRPIADNSTEEGRAQNRRVEFVVKAR